MAAGEGLEFHLDKVVPTNTMDAHRLIKLAESKNDRDLVERVINRFYKVYLTDGKSIADKDVLTAAAVEAQQLGIQGAPFFVINNKYAISGAQPYEVFVQALEKVKAEEK